MFSKKKALDNKSDVLFFEFSPEKALPSLKEVPFSSQQEKNLNSMGEGRLQAILAKKVNSENKSEKSENNFLTPTNNLIAANMKLMKNEKDGGK